MKTIYESKKQAIKEMAGSTHTLPILFEYAWSMARVWQKRDDGSFAATLRLAMTMLLLLALGSSSVWGQTGTDRSGIFYFVNCGSGKNGDPKIANITDPNNYFYLVPADNPKQDDKRDAWFSSDYSTANGDSEMPYLTTYKTKKDAADVPTDVTNRPHNSVWIVKFASTDSGTDYYNIIHAATGKYVVYEPPYSANNRKSMHLLTTDSPGENAKFAITIHSDNYNFRPMSIGTGTSINKYLNTAQQNYNYYYSSDGTNTTADGNANYYRGLVGLWKDAGDASDWKPEATLLTAPTINFDSDANTFSISYDKIPEGFTILYTIDGSEPTIGGVTTSTYEDSPILVTESITVKAVVARYGMVLTEVAEKTIYFNPSVTLSPTTSVFNGTVQTPDITVTDGSTTIDNSQYTITIKKNEEVVTECTDVGTYTIEITDREGNDATDYVRPCSAKFSITPAPLYGATLLNTSMVYDKEGQTITITKVTAGEDGSLEVPSDDYTVIGDTGTDVGNYTATITAKENSNYTGSLDIDFTITQKSIGDGSISSDFTIFIDEEDGIIVKDGSQTLIKDEDYTIVSETIDTKYTTKTISGIGNYTGSFMLRNAIVHFTTDNDQYEWSATFVAESSGASDIGHALPDGISAYIISAIEGRWVIPEPLDYIPVGVPVLLVTNEEKNGFLVTDAKSEEVTEITDAQKGYNKLKEVTVESAAFNTREIYVLYKNEFVLNKSGDLGIGKVYMENPDYVAPTPSPAPARLSIAWANVTGIHDMHNDVTMSKKDEGWYTIDGRHLNRKPTAKGLYIVNGKKTVVK